MTMDEVYEERIERFKRESPEVGSVWLYVIDPERTGPQIAMVVRNERYAEAIIGHPPEDPREQHVIGWEYLIEKVAVPNRKET